MNVARHTEYDIINNLLKNGKVLVCNNYKFFSKEDIMDYAISLSNLLDAKGVITIGWYGPNPQLCLNINE